MRISRLGYRELRTLMVDRDSKKGFSKEILSSDDSILRTVEDVGL